MNWSGSNQGSLSQAASAISSPTSLIFLSSCRSDTLISHYVCIYIYTVGGAGFLPPTYKYTVYNIYIYILYIYIIYILYYIYILNIYIYIIIYIYMLPPPKDLPFSAFCWCKNKVGILLLSKKMSTYSGQKAQHFLKEAICFKLQRSFSCLKKGNFIQKLQFSFQTKYDFVQETVPLQNIEYSSKHAVLSFWRSAVFLSN